MRFIGFWLFIIFILAMMGVGRIFYQQDNTLDVDYITSRFVWNENLYESEIQNTTNNMNLTERGIIHLKNIIYKGVSNIGFIGFEIAKFGIELGYTNPDYNYIWFAKIIVCGLILCILIYLIPALPIIISLVYLSFIGLKNGFINIKSLIRKKHMK